MKPTLKVIAEIRANPSQKNCAPGITVAWLTRPSERDWTKAAWPEID
jgi:hypothetical protein